MKLYEYLNPQEIVTETFAHPTLKVSARTRVMPTVEDASKIALSTIEKLFIRTLATTALEPMMADVLETVELTSGTYDESEDKSQWEEDLDNTFEEAIDSYKDCLSHDWLGKNTIACGLHLEDGIRKTASSMAKDIYKSITMELTPAKILSASGVTMEDLQAALDERIQSLTKPTEDKVEEQVELNDVIAKIAAHLGKGYDILTVHGDLDFASDEDDILANGAGARLGLDENDVRTLQCERVNHGDDTADVLSDMLKAASSGKPNVKKETKSKEKPVVEKAEPKVKKTKAVKETDETDAKEVVSNDVFALLKEKGGAKDADMAEALAVSRATYNNWANGKVECNLGIEQRTALREQIVDRINGLFEALALVDGTEANVVF